MNLAIHKEFLCLDCGYNTFRDEYYMVHDEIWLSVVPQRVGMLCIGCLELRLGWMLKKTDFTDAPINWIEGGFVKSQRLIDRLSY